MANEEGLKIVHETHDLVEVEWEVRDFPNQPCEYGEYLRSPHFLLGDEPMYLDICAGFPGAQGWISLYFCRHGSLLERPVSFSCGIKAGGEMIKNMENEYILEKRYCCEQQFIKGSSLHRFLKDSNGSLTIVCTARLLNGHRKEATTQTSRPDGLQVLSKQFEDLFLGGDGSDIKLKVGERVFDVHMLVLRTRCPVLAALFEDKMADNSTAVVDLIVSNPDHFQDFLLFIYTGDISHVTASNAVQLYMAAADYNIEDLEKECKSRILSDMSVDTVLDVLSLPTRYDDEEISLTALRFFIENAEETTRTDKWELLRELNAHTADVLMGIWTSVLRNHQRKNG